MNVPRFTGGISGSHPSRLVTEERSRRPCLTPGGSIPRVSQGLAYPTSLSSTVGWGPFRRHLHLSVGPQKRTAFFFHQRSEGSRALSVAVPLIVWGFCPFPLLNRVTRSTDPSSEAFPVYDSHGSPISLLRFFLSHLRARHSSKGLIPTVKTEASPALWGRGRARKGPLECARCPSATPRLCRPGLLPGAPVPRLPAADGCTGPDSPSPSPWGTGVPSWSWVVQARGPRGEWTKQTLEPHRSSSLDHERPTVRPSSGGSRGRGSGEAARVGPRSTSSNPCKAISFHPIRLRRDSRVGERPALRGGGGAEVRGEGGSGRKSGAGVGA